jgi:hypothetical protein
LVGLLGVGIYQKRQKQTKKTKNTDKKVIMAKTRQQQKSDKAQVIKTSDI